MFPGFGGDWEIYLDLCSLDTASISCVVPIGVFMFPHHNVELAARLVTEHESNVTMAIVMVDKPGTAVAHGTQVIVT